MLAGAGEEALGVFGREAREDGEGGVDQAVALGVAVIGGGGLEEECEVVLRVG